MRVHVKIIAWLHIIFGCFILFTFLLGQIAFLKSDWFRIESSVLDNSFLDRLTNLFNNYQEYFAYHGISLWGLFISFVIMIGVFFLGNGLLKLKEWARILGFIWAGYNLISIGLVIGYSPFPIIVITVVFMFYMVYILSSTETKELFSKTIQTY